MARYKLIFKPSARKSLNSIRYKKTRQQITERIETLSENPHMQGSEKLSGKGKSKPYHRIRQGIFRIIYTI